MDVIYGALHTILSFIYGNGMISQAGALLSLSPSDSKVNMVSSIIEISEDVAIPIASVLMCIYFIMDLVDQVSMERFNSDQFLKMLLKLAIGQFFITNATGFALQFMNVGASFMDAVMTSGISYNTVTIEESSLTSLGLIGGIGAIIINIIPFIIVLMIEISILMQCYARLFEMIIRAMMAPIGVCDIMHGGTNSQGFRYLKRCLAVALQGGLMLVVLIIGSTLAGNNAISSGTIDLIDVSNLISLIVIYGATSASMMTVKSLANDIVGA